MFRFTFIAAGLLTIAFVAAPTSVRAENDSRSHLPGVFETEFKKNKKTAAVSDETRKNDEILAKRSEKKKFKVASKFEPKLVSFSGYKAGTIVIDTKNKYLYLVERWGKARRYGVAVGREGLQFKGNAKIFEKQEWPRWIPTKDMIKRQPGKYAKYKDGMDGGPNNPLGARALYLYQGQVDTRIRIHGTNQPGSIGRAASNGCFRMVNEHVIDLYDRVRVGANVVVL
ncbi:MAG: L,D-transpeptidase [Rhizobiaceae bacterium]